MAIKTSREDGFDYTGYEQWLMDRVEAENWPDDMVSMDIGAHQGVWATFLSVLRPKGWIYAVEPVVPNLEYLIKNVQGLGNVLICPFALGNYNGLADLKLHFSTNRAGWTTSYHITERAGEVVDKVAVQCLDSLGLNRLDFIKIDAEGAEVDIVCGGLNTIKRCTPKMLIEFHDGKLGYSEKYTIVSEMLSVFGYTSQPLDNRNHYWFSL